MGNLAGKVPVVTAASKGIGAPIAEHPPPPEIRGRNYSSSSRC
jgi:hypothetical protein